jgi:glutamate/tyrosine decarboxylase-like PLP-dependent enzyme
MDSQALAQRLARGDVGSVVVTIGTTALGSVDPLPAILELKEKLPFRIHADAAYGGYFKLSGRLLKHTQESFELLHEADSIVIDPHKHGLQPYGCGCVLFRDPAVGIYYRHDSPYTYFTSGDLHLGEISLECSRPGASAVALWATQKLLPLVKSGDFGRSLDRCRSAAVQIYDFLRNDKRFIPGPEPELDILVWAVNAGSISEASERARTLFRKAAENDLHLAIAELPLHLFQLPSSMKRDRERIVCLRSVLMKPEHADWAERIWGIIDKAAG